jgi:MFS family permease
MVSLAVTNFAQLVVARMAAAVGEAGCKPPTYSLVGDYFPKPGERTRAMSIYWMAGPLAGLVGYVAGGWLNATYGWRMTFVLMGIPGIVLAVLVKLTLVDPRRNNESLRNAPRSLPPFKSVLATLWGQRSCRHLTIALILLYTMFFGINPWSLVFMMREHGMGSAELGAWWGVLSGIAGITGTLAGGYAASRWLAGHESLQMRFIAVTVGGTVVFYLAFLSATSRYVALFSLAVWFFVLNLFMAPTYALMQRLVADSMRATMMATIMLLYNLIGMGAGPQIVGSLSDGLRSFAGSDSLRYAMLIMVLMMFWSAYHFWKVGQTVKRDLDGVTHRAASALA